MRAGGDDGVMSAVIAPLTGAGTTDPAVGAALLLAVLLVGVAAGRAKRRLTLLVAGIVAVGVAGFLLASTTMPTGADRAALLTAFYAVSVPLAVAYLAGWLCGRGSWFKRILVIGAAAVLLAVFPYAEAAQATAAALTGAAR
jgi:hypothetical protein